MDEKDVLLAFTGEFDHLLITSLLKNIKTKLALEPGQKNTGKRVYNVLVESIENISRHASHESISVSKSIFLLCRSKTKYTIVTGNPILNHQIPGLKERFAQISNLTTDELKQLYRKQILSGKTSVNSAGLGIIDIAIRTGNNIQYDFRPLTETTSFYQFQTEIFI